MFIRNFSSFVLVLLWSAFLIPITDCACYRLDRSEIGQDEFQSCPNNVKTMCCALDNRDLPPGANITNGGGAKDECLPNGLCESRYIIGENMVQRWFRNFCTDPTWNPANCLKVCTENLLGGGNQYMTPCDDTRDSETWCCGLTKDCCNTNAAVTLALPFKGTTSQTSSSISSESSTTSSGPAPTNTTSSEDQSTNKGGLSTGAKAGIGVGASIGALAILALGYFIAKALHWKKKASGTPLATGTNDGQGQAAEYKDNPLAQEPAPYAPQSWSRAELPADRVVHQLP